MNCAQCNKQTDERYIIDSNGTEYCSEDCLETVLEEQDLAFDSHPYEDTYLLLRQAYIDFIDGWEEWLNKETSCLEREVDMLLDKIDQIIGDHVDFIYTEGDDGPYAWEIYQYTLKLKSLQKRIFAWRPNRRKLYWVTGGDDEYMLDIKEEQSYEQICTDLYLHGYEEFIFYVIKHHQHPLQWGLNYVFEEREMAAEAYNILLPFCQQRGVQLEIRESYKCEGYCGDILEAEPDLFMNGWFYCYTCFESEEHGIFTREQLDEELTYYAEHEEKRQIVIYERRDWCYPYKWKIQRSCRTYGVEVPTWAVVIE